MTIHIEITDSSDEDAAPAKPAPSSKVPQKRKSLSSSKSPAPTTSIPTKPVSAAKKPRLSSPKEIFTRVSKDPSPVSEPRVPVASTSKLPIPANETTVIPDSDEELDVPALAISKSLSKPRASLAAAVTVKAPTPSKSAPSRPEASEMLHVLPPRPSSALSNGSTASGKGKKNQRKYLTPPPDILPVVGPDHFVGRLFRDRVPFPRGPSLADHIKASRSMKPSSAESSRKNSVEGDPPTSASVSNDGALTPAINGTTEETSATGQLLDADVIDVYDKEKPGKKKLLSKAVKKRSNAIDMNRYTQAGPAKPGEFALHLQNHVNMKLMNRNDQIRGAVFEAMVNEQTRLEEPFAPPIRIIPHIAEAAPEFNFVYTNRVVYKNGVNSIQALGCLCTDGCKAGDEFCACYRRQSEENAKHDQPPGFAYSDKGRLTFQPDNNSAIFECNDMCGCPPECYNRVIGNGRAQPIDLYRTENCGWGAKLGELKRGDPEKKGKIKAGTFVGVYSGELVNMEEAKRRDQLYNAINLSYLFDLDFQSLGKNPDLQQFDTEGIAFISGNTKPKENNFVDGPAGSISITQGQDPNRMSTLVDEKQKKEELNEFRAIHAVDAYHFGNFTRFINHSCQPNCKLRCAYVNEGDPAKPFLAIFTVKTVYSGDVLSISYTGDVDLEDDDEPEVLNMPRSAAVARGKVKGKKTKPAAAVKAKAVSQENKACYCGAPRCTGRMFRDGSDDEEEVKADNALQMAATEASATTLSVTAP